MDKLKRNQKRDLELVHTELMDTMVRGQANLQHTMSWCASVELWVVIAHMLGKLEKRMQKQRTLALAFLSRHAREGVLRISRAEYDTMRDGIVDMRRLAGNASQSMASWAADVAEENINQTMQRTLSTYKATPQV